MPPLPKTCDERMDRLQTLLMRFVYSGFAFTASAFIWAWFLFSTNAGRVALNEAKNNITADDVKRGSLVETYTSTAIGEMRTMVRGLSTDFALMQREFDKVAAKFDAHLNASKGGP